MAFRSTMRHRASITALAGVLVLVSASGLPPAIARAEEPASSAARLPTDIRVAWSGVSAGAGVRPRVALTFDDGPNAAATARVLDLLRECDARATFFVVGQRVEAGGASAAALLRRMHAEGHEIGNHSWSHPNISRLSHAAIRDQVERTQGAVARACGVRPVLFRPPGGAMDFAAVRSLAGTEIRDVIMWSVDPTDWARPGRERIWRRVADAAQDGSIILLHDTHEETVRALPLIIDLLQARGFAIVPVSEVLQPS